MVKSHLSLFLLILSNFSIDHPSLYGKDLPLITFGTGELSLGNHG